MPQPNSSRPLASAMASATSIENLSFRMHRATESSTLNNPSNPELAYTGESAESPQAKMVQVLIGRIKNKLPWNTGATLDALESDEALMNTIQALIDLSRDALGPVVFLLVEELNALKRYPDQNRLDPINVLASQLFLLKILSWAIAMQWSDTPAESRPESRADGALPAVSKGAPTAFARLPQRQASGSSTIGQSAETSQLTGDVVGYILKTMTDFLRQTAPPDIRVSLASGLNPDSAILSDFESIEATIQNPFLGPGQPRPFVMAKVSSNSLRSAGSSNIQPASGIPIPIRNMSYEKTSIVQARTSLSLNIQIAKYTGRIIYHLSISNWNTVLNRIQTRIRSLESFENTQDVHELGLLAYSALDKQRLSLILNGLSSLIVSMSTDARVAIATPLRSAIWNWIRLFPSEFNEAIRNHRARLDVERLFEHFLNDNLSGHEKNIWPLATVLNLIRFDRNMLQFAAGNKSNTLARKEQKFLQDLSRHANGNSKLSDVALVCLMDICYAAIHVNVPIPEDSSLRMSAVDVVHDLKSSLFDGGGENRPFWTRYDIDPTIYADILVAAFRFLPIDESLPLFVACWEPERSNAVKLCAIMACITIGNDIMKFPWQPPAEMLIKPIRSRLLAHFKSLATRRSEVDARGNVRTAALRPKIRRFTTETLPDHDLTLLYLLSIMENPISTLVIDVSDEEIRAVVEASASIWAFPFDMSVKLVCAHGNETLQNLACTLTPTDQHYDLIQRWMDHSLHVQLMHQASTALHLRSDPEAQRLILSVSVKNLEPYSRTLPPGSDPKWRHNPERFVAIALAELAYLVSLPSGDLNVAKVSSEGLRMVAFSDRCFSPEEQEKFPPEARAPRNRVYELLGDPQTLRVIGRVNHQKKLRNLIRRMIVPYPFHTAIWQECYRRWRQLLEVVVPNVDLIPSQDITPASPHEKYEWEHLSLCMSAFGGVYVSPDLDLEALTQLIPARYLPDLMCHFEHPLPLIEAFLAKLTELLLSNDAAVQSVARRSLSEELNARLYAQLVKHLHRVTGGMAMSMSSGLTGHGRSSIEQFIAVLKTLSDNSRTRATDVLGVDTSAVLHNLTLLVTRVADRQGYTLKMSLCSLIDCICTYPGALVLRRDAGARYGILDKIIEWIQDPTQVPRDECRLQYDLNIVSLKTACRLLDRLVVRPPGSDDRIAEEDEGSGNPRLLRYTNDLIRCLRTCLIDLSTSDGASDGMSIQSRNHYAISETELPQLVITGLANLLQLTNESGFKRALTMAYDEDPRQRIIFALACARVLGQGTQLVSTEPSNLQTKRHRLCELVRESDMILAVAICETCPHSEQEMMIQVLMNLYDTRPALMRLLKVLIERELDATDNQTQLFRGNSFASLFVSHFTRLHGYNYLRSLIIPLIKAMSHLPPDHSFEVDPARLAPGQSLEHNRENVRNIAGVFLRIIVDSLPILPSMIREITAYIGNLVAAQWPESKFAAIGNFMFLRFISPALRQVEDIHVELPPEKAGMMRDALRIVTKIVQSLANNIQFGKEPHMAFLNDFLQTNIMSVTKYLNDIYKNPSTNIDTEPEEWSGATFDDTDAAVLHRFFHMHADRIGRDLLSYVSRDGGELAAATGRRAWNQLCTVLVDLGDPVEISKASLLRQEEHHEFLGLLLQYSERSEDSVRKIFTECPSPPSGPVFFVLSTAQLDVDIVDHELLMFYILRSIALVVERKRQYQVVIDCTSFSSSSELPFQWIQRFVELLPLDLRENFDGISFLLPNATAINYIRRINYLSAGGLNIGDIKSFSSVSTLLEEVSPALESALESAVRLENQKVQEFTDVMMREGPQQVPVRLAIGSEYLRINSLKTHKIRGIKFVPTEIIPLADINDLYNLYPGSTSRGPEQNEFILRRRRQRDALFYFSTPDRDTVVKAIRNAQSRFKQSITSHLQNSLTPLSSIPATLLHIGMLHACSSNASCSSANVNHTNSYNNAASTNEELRSAAFALLDAACVHLNYNKSPVLASKSGFIPFDSGSFVVQLSDRLSIHAPQLTIDFIQEVYSGLAREDQNQRIACLRYMSPWIKNLALFSNPSTEYYERSESRLRGIIRTLVELTIFHEDIALMVQKYVWAEVAKLDNLLHGIALEELLRIAIDAGCGAQRSEIVGRILAILSSIQMRGKIFTKLRKVLGKMTSTVSKRIDEMPTWNEVATLIRIAYLTGSSSRHPSHHQLYMPEIAYVVSLVAGTGETLVRKSAFGIIVNLVQSLQLARPEDAPDEDLRALLDQCLHPDTIKLFGLQKHDPIGEYHSLPQMDDKSYIDNQETLSLFLVKILECTSVTSGLLNVWRARWMSLVASTAFQLAPAIQSRCFIVLGTLGNSQMDDDFLYQMLISLSKTLRQMTETDSTPVTSLLRCITRVVPSLENPSRYLPNVFWLAVALLQAGYIPLYEEASELLRVSVETMETHGYFKDSQGNQRPMHEVLMESREDLEDEALQLDHLLRLSFRTNFSFSLAAIIFKGVRHTGLRKMTETLLRSLLNVTIRSNTSSHHSVHPEALGFFLALLPSSSTPVAYESLLNACLVSNNVNVDGDVPNILLEHVGLGDEIEEESEDDGTEETATTTFSKKYERALLTVSFIGTMIGSAQGDDAETESLYSLLAQIALAYPNVVAIAYDSLQDRIRSSLASSSNASIISAVSTIFRVATAEPYGRLTNNPALDSVSTLNTQDAAQSLNGPGRRQLAALEKLEMPGLANRFLFLPTGSPEAKQIVTGFMPQLIGRLVA